MAVNTNPPNVYIMNCVEEVSHSVYGRDNRKPIHDAIEYIVYNAAQITGWKNDLGLVVEDGKLCVTYDPNGGGSPSSTTPPLIVLLSLSGILTDIYGSEMRSDIAGSLGWAVTNIVDLVTWWRSLGLIHKNGMVCYTNRDTGTIIPSSVQNALDGILTETKGSTLRSDIVRLLRFGVSGNSNMVKTTINEIIDTGLGVSNGKLCITYNI